MLRPFTFLPVLPISCLLANLAHAETPTKICKVREALNKGYDDGKGRHKLDVFSPEGAAKRPVVLFIHGGAWIIGDKDFFGLYRGVGQFLASRGIVTVLVNYRLSPGVQHPEHVKDIARAYAWVRKNIDQYGGDPSNIFLAGHSAGGHLAALLGTDDSYWQDKALGLKPADRASLRGVIGISGVYRIPKSNETTAMIAELMEGVRTNGLGGVSPRLPFQARPRQDFKLFQIVFGNDPEVRAKASPVNHARKGLPPFLLLYAERDLPMLPEMAQAFATKLKSAGNQAKAQLIPISTHNNIVFNLGAAADPTARALLDFINQHAARPIPAGKP